MAQIYGRKFLYASYSAMAAEGWFACNIAPYNVIDWLEVVDEPLYHPIQPSSSRATDVVGGILYSILLCSGLQEKFTLIWAIISYCALHWSCVIIK